MKVTLGCRANQYQTNQLAAQFSDENVIIINTCCVTLDAERKSRQAIRRALRQNPQAKIIVAGCLARLDRQKLQTEFPNITITFPNPLATCHLLLATNVRTPLMIQDGCENFCSYCIVPFVRGPIKSKPIEQVIEEAKTLIAAGAKEIVLTGINLGTYQFDLKKVFTLLSVVCGLERVRLSSIEPMYLTKELIDHLAATPKVCHHLHLPLQSGDDQILQAMNRRYNTKEYLELIDYIRRKIPDCGITTDVIVGFPGETEQNFKNTIKTIKQAGFSRLHVFPFSKRLRTVAAKLPDQVAGKIIKDRVKKLRELSDQLAVKFTQQYLNQEVEILVESIGVGLTSNFIRCRFSDPDNSSGKLYKIIPNKVVSCELLVVS